MVLGVGVLFAPGVWVALRVGGFGWVSERYVAPMVVFLLRVRGWR